MREFEALPPLEGILPIAQPSPRHRCPLAYTRRAAYRSASQHQAPKFATKIVEIVVRIPSVINQWPTKRDMIIRTLDNGLQEISAPNVAVPLDLAARHIPSHRDT